MENRLYVGDAIEILRTLPDSCVQVCVTSPPYFGLRDYGTAIWEGGDVNCDHVKRTAANISRSNRLGKIPGYRDSLPVDNAAFKAVVRQYRSICRKCGARRVDRQIGMETEPSQYIARLVEVFREVNRILRNDGTLWLNIGDKFSTKCIRDGVTINPKDLIGIPWMLAFALREDGWYLRSDIIWHKPDAMPESVKDRPTKAHEHIFLLAKSRRYFYDADAIKEPSMEPHRKRGDPIGHTQRRLEGRPIDRVATQTETRSKRSVWTIPTSKYKKAHFATFPPNLIIPCILAGSREGDVVLDPFIGSGTTAVVSASLGRQYIGIDINPDYILMAENRIRNGK